MRELVKDYDAQAKINYVSVNDTGSYRLNDASGGSAALDYSLLAARGTVPTKIINGNGGYQFARLCQILPSRIKGRTITISSWVNTPASTIDITRREIGGTTYVYNPHHITVTPNTWTFVSLTLTASTENFAYLQIDLGHEAAQVTGPGMTWWAHSAMITQTDYVTEYFDINSMGMSGIYGTDNTVGSLPSATIGYPGQFHNKLSRRVSQGPDLDKLWRHSSSGGQPVATITDVTDPIANTAITHALDVVVPAATPGTPRLWNLIQAPHNLHMLQGETWTVSYYAKLISSDNPSVTLRMKLLRGDGSNPVFSGTASDTPTTSWQRFSYTFVVGADAVYVYPDSTGNNLLYLAINDMTGAVHFRVSGFSLERGATGVRYSPPYFNDANDYLYSSTTVDQAFDDGAYNDPGHDIILDGGGVFSA